MQPPFFADYTAYGVNLQKKLPEKPRHNAIYSSVEFVDILMTMLGTLFDGLCNTQPSILTSMNRKKIT